MWRFASLAILVICLCLFTGALADAQSKLPSFDEHLYDTLAAADSNATIEPGTVINAQNWQKYKQFMPMGLQLLLSGQLPTFNVPADFQMIVGPTQSYPLPKRFIADSEKYSPQVRLTHLPDGGTSLQGYVSGLPFPHPSGPDEGIELLWDTYYNWQPHIGQIDDWAQTTDRYLNRSASKVKCVHFKQMHISDPGLPPNLAANGIFLTENCEVWEPEQSKYVTALQVFYDDPARVAENYAFIPSLRRSLRLSAAARCSPFAGGDFTNDDFRNGMNLQVPIFRSRFLGLKKILTMVFPDNNFYQTYTNNAPAPYYYPSFIPRPSTGKWQLRDMYVFDNRRIESQTVGYCYGDRVMFLDKEQFAPQWLDLYDAELKYWKFYWNLYHPGVIPETGEHTFGSGTSGGFALMQEFQNTHEDAAWQIPHWGRDVPTTFQDYTRWGTPAGLSQVMQ